MSLLALALLPLAAAPAAAATFPPSWVGTVQGRLAADAALHDLSDRLASTDSATSVLDGWCAEHQMAVDPKIKAERIRGDERSAPPEIRTLLKVSATERVGYRHVRLRCGQHVLSDADNWYVPARLTPDINRQLDTSDTPFGRAAQPLHFRRYTLSSQHLWSPLPRRWETLPSWRWPHRAEIDVAETVIENRAVLLLPDGAPISAVVERYTGAVLAYPAPPVAR
jgi:chorismate-pyruvate lyase